MNEIKLKEKVGELLSSADLINLDIGCGSFCREGYIGVDAIEYANVQLVGDVFQVLSLFPDESVNSIYTSHFIEHLEAPQTFLNEIKRVLKNRSEATIIAPHFSNPYFYSDPTHKAHYGLYTLSYYFRSDIFSRKVPSYSMIEGILLKEVYLCFKSNRPFYLRYAFKKTIGLLVNMTNFTKEFYEENLTWIIPPYEIEYRILKNI